MTTYGLTSVGLVPKVFSVVKEEWEAKFRELVGYDVDLEPESVYGQVVGVASERETALWELLEAIYGILRAENAEGSQLDTLLAFVNATRLGATKGTVTLTACGTGGTVIPAGSVANVDGTGGSRWVTKASGTLVVVTAWVTGTYYAVGGRCSNNGSKIYEATVAGTSGSTGPTGTGNDIADGSTLRWRYVGAGLAAANIASECEDTGPLPGHGLTITKIATPVSGWSSVTNLEDAQVGRDGETDAAYRLRRYSVLRAAGCSALDQLLAKIELVDGVTWAAVFENVSEVVDSAGRPPNTFEAVVEGGTDADIAAALWANKPTGIDSFGTTTITVTDSKGSLHAVKHSRPTDLEVWVWCHVEVDDTLFPEDGEDLVKDALADWGAANLGIGQNVFSSKLAAVLYGIPGVVNVHPTPGVGLARYPEEDDQLAVEGAQHARLSTDRIDVTTY